MQESAPARAGDSLPRSPPQPGRARHLSLPAFGLRAAVDDPLGDVGETSKPNRREATHMACSFCEDCFGGTHGVRSDAHGVPSLRGCCDGPSGVRSDAHGVLSLRSCLVLPLGEKHGSIRCEATHNEEAASEAVHRRYANLAQMTH